MWNRRSLTSDATSRNLALLCILVPLLLAPLALGASPQKPLDLSVSHQQNPKIFDDIPDGIAKPIAIGVTFMVNQVISLDEKTGEFLADIDLGLQWLDPHLGFDEKKQGSSVINLNPTETSQKMQQIWSPHLVISNMQSIETNVGTLAITNTGTIDYTQRIKAIFKVAPKLKAFPFDTQKLELYLDANNYTIHEVQFIQTQNNIDRSGIREGVGLDGWSFKGVVFDNTWVRNANGSFYPRFNAQIVMRRIPFSHLVAFAPLLLIMLSPTIITLFSQSSTESRLGAWGASLLTLIAISFALNQKYPALSPDSILPQVITIVLAYQFVMIFLTVTVVNPKFMGRFKNPYIVDELLSYLRWAIPLGLILLITSRVILVSLYSPT